MLRLALATLVAATTLLAQNPVQVPLNYNWNGIVHAGEAGQPDAPNGFRAISDRSLDFTAGVPNDALLARYAIEANAGVLDLVHLGNRNTVDGGNWAFDPLPDNDNRGIQPSWLANPNQTAMQVTSLATPLTIGLTSTASVLFHVSNGGGTFDVVFTYQDNSTRVHTLTGPDWFGGVYPGRDSVDRANPGNNLNLIERTVDLSADAGKQLVQIAFGNRGNSNAGYAIFGVNVVPAPTPRQLHHIALNHNWNGVVHAGEDQLPDAPNGYRSIAGRGLDFRGGVPNTALLNEFVLVDTPGALDLVMLGNRNTVAGGAHAFDPVANTNSIGTQPTWLPSVDLSGPQTTLLPAPILLDAASSASFLFQCSSGGGAFDVTFELATGAITTTLWAGDWVGGSYLGCADTDRALPGLPLHIEQITIDLSPAAGLVLTGITFSNRSNPNGSCAILAANVTGCLACGNSGGPLLLGGGTGPTMQTSSSGALGCPLQWTVAGASPSTPLGFFAAGIGISSLPLANLVPGCGGTVHVPNAFLCGAVVDATGGATFAIAPPTAPAFCGLLLTVQYVEFVTAACPLRLSDALAITIGN